MPDADLADAEGEFGFIERHLRPLAAGQPGALDLADDAALLEPTAGMQLVLAKDALVEGVHFLPHDSPENIAQKALRVNLSDMAAMGATPRGYLLALMRPKRLPPEWLGRFSHGLGQDQGAFGITMLGGDTVVTPGPLTLSVTMFGDVPRGQSLRRAGARAGDDVYVSGTLGGAALGLQVLHGRLSPPMSASEFLIRRYRLPEPRIGLGEALRGVAHAAIDISDGLLADLGHVLAVSGKGATIHTDWIPLSQAAAPHRGALEAALTGGDDYELLFTAHPEQRPAIQAIGEQLSLPLTVIGQITEGTDLEVLDARGYPISIDRKGWQHF
ncbi:MAG: thiamine-phosphate kinase [Pseudomonadota bacterium]